MPVSESVREKIALFTDVEPRAVVPGYTAQSVYEVPLMLEEEGVADFIAERLGLDVPRPDLAEWRALGRRDPPDQGRVCKIALVGKYVELEDAYMSVREALRHAAWALDRDVEIDWMQRGVAGEAGRARAVLAGVDGILVPGGFGERGIEGKIAAARYAREQRHPLLRAVPGHAGDVHRVRPQRAAAWRMPTAPSSTPRRPTRSSA